MPVIVPAQLPRGGKAKIAFVGEAPGDMEEMSGVPLSGPSGKIFDAGLRAAGIDRGECLVTNVLDFKLPKNDIKNISVKKYEAAGPFAAQLSTPVAAGAYLPQDIGEAALVRLRAELEAVQPDVIVPLGGTALWAVLGVQGHGTIKKLRGAVSRAKLFDAPALPTFHPAYILRTYHQNIMFVSDLCKAVRVANGDPGKNEFTIWEVKRPEDFDKFIAKLSPPIAVDIETVKRCAIDCIGFSDGKNAFTMPFFDNKTFKPYWSPEDEIDARRRVCRWLEGATAKLGQNFTYDLQMLWETWRVQVRNYAHDTRLCHHALFPELPKDLGSMSSLHTFLPSWKPIKSGKGKKDE